MRNQCQQIKIDKLKYFEFSGNIKDSNEWKIQAQNTVGITGVSTYLEGNIDDKYDASMATSMFAQQ